MIGENEFFREATLRLCSHLDIGESLQACFEFLSQHIPADGLYLERFEPEFNAMRLMVRASAEGGERIDVLIPLSQDASEAMAGARKAWQADKLPPVLVINNPREEPVTRCILETIGVPPSSAMSLPLIVENQVAGALALIAEGDDRFNDDHVRLYTTLKEPFFIAMSNFLEHNEVLRLRDRLEDDNRYLNRELLRLSGDEIVGADFGLREVMRQVREVGSSFRSAPASHGFEAAIRMGVG
jgi:transcriptional regulator with GAF, ATPase, and Fis domain